MDKEMFLFYKNAIARNLCKEYNKEFKEKIENKEELLQLSLRLQSIPFVATACYNNWGLDLKYAKNAFKDYINGKKVIKNCDKVEGYNYGLWIDYNEDINVELDIMHLMACHCNIYIPPTKCPTIYISNKSKVKISDCDYNCLRIYLFDESEVEIENLSETNSAIIYKYSDKCNVVESGICEGKIKQFNKEIRL